MPNSLFTDLTTSEARFTELLAEAERYESPLGGGKKMKLGALRQELERLKSLRVDFGDPRASLTRLTPRLLEGLGGQASALLREQWRERFDLYYLSVPVTLRPARGTTFWRVECELVLSNPDGDPPLIQRMFPQGEWQPVLEWGGSLTLALDADVQWGIEVEPKLLARLDYLPAKLKPRVSGHDGLTGFIRLPAFSFNLGRATIVAEGLNSSEAFWRVEGQSVKRAQNLQFSVVIKVPKAAQTVHLKGVVGADPEFDGLVTNAQNVWEHLSVSFKALLQRLKAERRGAERLLSGAGEEWDLFLPIN